MMPKLPTRLAPAAALVSEPIAAIGRFHRLDGRWTLVRRKEVSCHTESIPASRQLSRLGTPDLAKVFNGH
jgi:hypothetical protein